MGDKESFHHLTTNPSSKRKDSSDGRAHIAETPCLKLPVYRHLIYKSVGKVFLCGCTSLKGKGEASLSVLKTAISRKSNDNFCSISFLDLPSPRVKNPNAKCHCFRNHFTLKRKPSNHMTVIAEILKNSCGELFL